jgi:demethylmenaquinone methyltransferase/2-methoxy-6-polyprenyl-1,4-benzoquinol methylase
MNTEHQKNIKLSEKSLKIQKMFDKISNRYDILNRLLSGGQDLLWRRKMIAMLPQIPQKNGILYDVACGTGDILCCAAKNRKDYRQFVGFDISNGMLQKAEKRAKKQNLPLLLKQASGENLPAPDNSADCVTISFGLRNIENRTQALKEFHRILKKEGTLCVLEFFETQNTFLSQFFNFYFKKILPKIGGMFSDKTAYEYLPHSVSSMPTGTQFQNCLEELGFFKIKEHRWLSGTTRLFTAIKKV